MYDFLAKSPDVLMRNSEHLDTVLDTLDAQLHSLGVLAIYMVKFMILNQNSAQNQGIQIPDPEVLINQVSQFITVCNGEQIRCAPDSCNCSIICLLHKIITLLYCYIVAELCNQFTQCLVERNLSTRGIVPLTKAICKARMNETQLTSIHSNLLQLCLMAQNLKPAMEFLNIDISEINSEVIFLFRFESCKIIMFSVV